MLLTTLNLAAGVILWLTGCCKKCLSDKSCTINCYKDSDKNYGKLSIRTALTITATAIEVGLAITCFIFGTSRALADSKGNSV